MDVSLAGHFLAAASPSVIRHGGPGGRRAPGLGLSGSQATGAHRGPVLGGGQPDLGRPDPGSGSRPAVPARPGEPGPRTPEVGRGGLYLLTAGCAGSREQAEVRPSRRSRPVGAWSELLQGRRLGLGRSRGKATMPEELCPRPTLGTCMAAGKDQERPLSFSHLL